MGKKGIHVPAEDWDTLVILDACRFDVFKERSKLEGDLKRRISKGSHTREFLSRNFEGEKFPDIVYISTSPQVDSLDINENFYAYEPLWKTHWDDDLETVPPSEAVDATIDAVERYPNKRIISHMIQPHYPFIGETGQNISHRSLQGGDILGTNANQKSIWTKLANGEVSKESVYNAYVENLDLALTEVERLLNKIEGKTVVTSDHGNSFGEWGVYGHPQRRFIESLVKVPWLTVNSGNRRTISGGKLTSQTDQSENIEQRLHDLGYME
ncbi:hypothetical protein [Haloarcula amylovorans]|uniref:hypothetical protein n=1 Tax=Haloarcula amylovorans TaxID=2562280 RepID=UPI00107692FA|nr:hypothetical protein [Halomicroarcula amylolytica]